MLKLMTACFQSRTSMIQLDDQGVEIQPVGYTWSITSVTQVGKALLLANSHAVQNDPAQYHALLDLDGYQVSFSRLPARSFDPDASCIFSIFSEVVAGVFGGEFVTSAEPDPPSLPRPMDLDPSPPGSPTGSNGHGVGGASGEAAGSSSSAVEDGVGGPSTSDALSLTVGNIAPPHPPSVDPASRSPPVPNKSSNSIHQRNPTSRPTSAGAPIQRSPDVTRGSTSGQPARETASPDPPYSSPRTSEIGSVSQGSSGAGRSSKRKREPVATPSASEPPSATRRSARTHLSPPQSPPAPPVKVRERSQALLGNGEHQARPGSPSESQGSPPPLKRKPGRPRKDGSAQPAPARVPSGKKRGRPPNVSSSAHCSTRCVTHR